MERQKVYVDGSASPNFGSAYCIVVIKAKPVKILKKIEGQFNSKFMEYFAILQALRECELGSSINSDCLNVVREIKENWFHKEIYSNMHKEIRNLLISKNCELNWVSRHNNPAGQNLEERLFKLKKVQCNMFHEVFKQDKRRKNLLKHKRYMKK